MSRYILKNKIISAAAIILLFLVSNQAFAADITTTTVDNRNDFVLEPAKMEILLEAGEKATRYIYVTSRIDKPTKFKIDIEDFIGSDQPDKPVLLLGNDRSPYSLKDYLKPDISDFTLNFGERIRIPIAIELPANAAPGGFYASVLISNAPDKEATSTDQSGARTISRVGSLLFVKIKGPVNEEGKLEDFRVKDGKLIYPKADLTFDILFKNTGSVHLVPYGSIEIKNIWGKVVDTVPVDAYFSLPKSIRYREVPWQKENLLGFYRATLSLHRGYGDDVDTKTISLLFIPWKILITIFVIIVILLLVYSYIRKNFEFRRKKKRSK